MKKLLALLAVILCWNLTGYAQDTVSSIKVYAGITSILQYQTRPTVTLAKNTTSLYLAAESTIDHLLGTLVLRAIYKPDNGGFGQVFNVSRLSGKLSLSFGRFGRPITQIHRPSPVSAGGDFESPGVAEIPGASNGVKMDFRFGTTVLMGGLYDKNGKAEYNVALSTGLGKVKIMTGGYYSPELYGGSLGIIYSAFDALVYRSEKSGSFNLNVDTFLPLYGTGVYDYEGKKWTKMEYGFYKSFGVPSSPIKNTSVTVGAGWLPLIDGFHVYGWFHI